MKGVIYGIKEASAPISTPFRIASDIAVRLRNTIFKNFGFTSSAGISHNKLLAKMGSHLNKPNNQTYIPFSTVPALLASLPLKSLPFIGKHLSKGKLKSANQLEEFKNVHSIAELPQLCTVLDLEEKVGKESAEWILKACQGIDNSIVKNKGPPKSIMSSMSLTPFSNDDLHAKNIFTYLGTELMERLINDSAEFNHRQPKTITFSYRLIDAKEKSQSIPIAKFKNLIELVKDENIEEGAKIIANTCLGVFINDMGESRWTIRWSGVTATNFTEAPTSGTQITDYFKKTNSISPSSNSKTPAKKQKTTNNSSLLQFFDTKKK